MSGVRMGVGGQTMASDADTGRGGKEKERKKAKNKKEVKDCAGR